MMPPANSESDSDAAPAAARSPGKLASELELRGREFVSGKCTRDLSEGQPESDRDESLLPAVMNSDLNLHEAF